MKKNKMKKGNWLEQVLVWQITPVHLFIMSFMGISLFLHFYKISAIGNANSYYTAAVKSMLVSWKNFFFAAAEPGGSVTVDKPPLGLWIETAFAYVLGVNGIAVSLPNILAGVFSIPLIYHLTKKYFGPLSGIVAALTYVFTPVVLAADRNNTIDGMLVFSLLLAAWAFIKATDTGKFRFLIIGSVIVGLGFNIKMLQAYLALPALLLMFLFGSHLSWGLRMFYSLISVIVILSVSLSWAVVVDLVPADERPYIGSSENNTVMELIIGHNGLARLFGKQKYTRPIGIDSAGGIAPDRPNFPPIDQPDGNGQALPANGQTRQPGSQQPQATKVAGNAFSRETGAPGIFRLFQAPLGKEMSWLLPFALFSLVVITFSQPISLTKMTQIHKGMILWGGWLLTCIIFFSMADFFHAYYMIMLVPPLTVLTGTGVGWITSKSQNGNWKIGVGVFALSLTLLYQIYLANAFISFPLWLFVPMAVFAISSTALLFIQKERSRPLIILLLFLSVLFIPAWWSVQTVLDDNPHNGLPSAYNGQDAQINQPPAEREDNSHQDALIQFLDQNTTHSKYLAAVQRANDGAPFVLATGRPVLYMGGFTGSDNVVSVDDLQWMVHRGELNYILFSGANDRNQAIHQWVRKSCSVVEEFSTRRPDQKSLQDGPRQTQSVLFDCSKN